MFNTLKEGTQMESDCDHRHIELESEFGRDAAGQVTAEVKIRCGDCGRPYGFLGVMGGYAPDKPSRDLTGETLTLPLISPEQLAQMGADNDGMAGTVEDPQVLVGAPGDFQPLENEVHDGPA
jgi:hypothetical protein